MTEDRSERLAISTSTTGVEIGIYPARLREVMFASTAALAGLGRYDREDGRSLPVTVGSVVGTAGSAGANTWGDAFLETGEGASRARKDPTFADSVKFDEHTAQWQIISSHEQVRDMLGFEPWLEARAAQHLGMFLLWRAAAGSGSGQGQGVRGALDGATHNLNGTAQKPAVSDLKAMRFESVASPYRQHPSCGWWMGDDAIKDTSELTDGDEPILKYEGVPAGAEALLLGKPVYAVPGFPAFGSSVKGTIAFGAWECMGLSLVGDLRPDRSAHVDLLGDQIRFRFSQGYDTQLVDAAGLCLFNSGA